MAIGRRGLVAGGVAIGLVAGYGVLRFRHFALPREPGLKASDVWSPARWKVPSASRGDTTSQAACEFCWVAGPSPSMTTEGIAPARNGARG